MWLGHGGLKGSLRDEDEPGGGRQITEGFVCWAKAFGLNAASLRRLCGILSRFMF